MQLLRHEKPLITLSDAGAHAEQLCDACWSTWLLQHWVRETGVLTLEQAIWRLTGHPARVFRLAHRGAIRPGYHADLVAFDPEHIAVGPPERRWDLPGGASRLFADSFGIEACWVNGTAVRLNGHNLVDVHPGQVIRGRSD